jgi:heme-degrading monooxygenase HmoA
MFARILEFVPKMEKKEELIRLVQNEVLPILKKQPGFMEILPFEPEVKNEKVLTVTLWAEKRNFERYEKETFPKIEELIKPYLNTPILVHNVYKLETRLCEHFEKALIA